MAKFTLILVFITGVAAGSTVTATVTKLPRNSNSGKIVTIPGTVTIEDSIRWNTFKWGKK